MPEISRLPVSAEEPAELNVARRSALFAGAGAALLALTPVMTKAATPSQSEVFQGAKNDNAPREALASASNTQDDERIVPIYDEPKHHVIMQNSEVRVMRVMIPAGSATLWHAQNLDYVNTIINGSHNIIARKGEGPGEAVEMVSGSVRYGDYQRSPIVDRVSNIGQTLNHQVAFEITDLARGNYGSADRSHVTHFSVILDKPRVRGWRLTLAPGETTEAYRQDGPGVRVVLAGSRLIEKRPGEVGQQVSLRHGDAMFTNPSLVAITNAGEDPLEVMEYELL